MAEYKNWSAGFDAANTVAHDTGRVHQNTDTILNGVHVGAWVARQHHLAKLNKLAPERVNLLRSLPGALPTHKLTSQWETTWKALRPQILRHGLDVPRKQVVNGLAVGDVLQRIMVSADPTGIALRNLCRATAGIHGPDTLELIWIKKLREAIAKEDPGWIATQMQAKSEGKLDGWQNHALSTLVPADTLDEAVWNNSYDMLFEHIIVTGESFPDSKISRGGILVGEFSRTQRGLLNDGALDEAKREALSLLPGWSDTVAASQDPGTRSLARTFNHAMDQGTFPRNLHAAKSWVVDARVSMNGGHLSERQQLIATSIPGFTWNQPANGFKLFVAAAVSYVQEHGQLNCTPWTVRDGLPLGVWLSVPNESNTNQLLAAGILPHQIPEPLRGERLWSHMFRLLDEWIAQNDGDTPAKDVLYRDVPLGAWYWTVSYFSDRGLLPATQMKAFQNALHGHDWHEHFVAVSIALEAGTMATLNRRAQLWMRGVRQWHSMGISNQQTEALGSLEGFQWAEPDAERFTAAAQRVDAYVRQNKVNPYTIGREVMDGSFRLGQFIAVNRELHRTGELPGWKIRALERVKNWKWHLELICIQHRTLAQWFDLLTRWQAENGPIMPDRSVIVEGDVFLGAWVESQRQRYRTNGVSGESVARLEAFPGWSWEPTVTRVAAHGAA